MKEHLYKNFIEKLEQIYGSFNERRKSFEKASNSKIARELCYSDSQFSRLINESASEGEYKRATRNVKRVLNEIRLQEEVKEKSKDKARGNSFFGGLSAKSMSVVLVLLAVLLIVFTSARLIGDTSSYTEQVDRDHMLEWIFENSSVSPYLNLDELPNDCSYTCYKYQGQWSLKDPYKIPVFRERNGFHYLATDVNLYTRCKTEEGKDGNMLEGYEYQKHEIWYDKRELQIDSFLVSTDKTQINDSYRNLEFQEDTNFVLIAHVHTFFRNEFEINAESVSRSGKVVGRDVELVQDEQLLKSLHTTSRVNDIKNEMNRIVANRLEDFSRPISCRNAALADQDFHSVNEEDTMSFNCQLTTANAPIKYTKTYILDDQYIETTCRPEL